MEKQERESRRDTFQRRADDYSAVRPGYPDVLLETALSLGELTPDMTVLEVGCGTGQLTLWLAGRGFRVQAIDRSLEMVAVAADRLSDFPQVSVSQADFDEESAHGRYAGLFAATSYHWLDPDRRVQRCAEVLEPGGALVLLWHVHPLPYTGFFARVEPIYQSVFTGRESLVSSGMSEEGIQAVCDELQASGHFTSVVRRAHDWERTYETEIYLRLLDTYSDHQRLEERDRGALYRELAEIIESEYGGAVVRPYRTELVVARTPKGAG
jgi:SAM-dependent methyltransferase